MKKLINLSAGILFSVFCFSQNEEFKVYPNGLIYSDAAMEKLSFIVDSLNLKFETCDYDKVFYSKQQVVGHLVTLDTGDIKGAKRDLQRNISFEEFAHKYPEARLEKNILIIRNKYIDYKNKEYVVVSHFDLESDYGFRIESEDLKLYETKLKNKWLFDYQKESEYYSESIKSFFFPENFESVALPQRYSSIIGYAHCLIDTNTTKLNSEQNEGWVDLPKNWKKLPTEEKALLLEEMRATRVIGFCSQDQRPGEHAFNIALLSAETYNWQVFLKAHLDIMNDRFERMSDGSYAWAKRHTYIQELEHLNINLTDLILGISLRVENPVENHYYGSIWRVGRALSETTNRREVEEEILAAISDEELDYFNRLLFCFLFKNYNQYIDDEVMIQENNEKLISAISLLPAYFSDPLMKLD